MSEAIQLIAVDLDHTLLNSAHAISERNERALRAAMEQGVKVILATGKTRRSALAVIEQLDLQTPGIFVQGLVIHNADGSIRHQSALDPALARRVITFAEDRGFVAVAYSGEQMMVRRLGAETDVLESYGEPTPLAVGPLQNILDDTVINKLLIAKKGEPRRIKALRWQLSMQLEGAHITQAGVPDMLEVLPSGTSKGAGLRALLKEMQIAPAHVMAVGDGENDIEMIQLAGIGVAVGNAADALKAAADHVVASADADGVAEAIERFVLPPIVEPTAEPDTTASTTPTTTTDEETE